MRGTVVISTAAKVGLLQVRGSIGTERKATMDHGHPNPTPYPAGEPPFAPDDVTVPGTDEAPSWHRATTVPLAEFSLTRDQVVAMYVAAGIKVERRTVSRYAQEGTLRAQKVDAERGLKRYLFDKNSVEADIAKRLRGPGSIYAPVGEDDIHDEATVPSSDDAPSRHGATTVPRLQALSARGDRVRELEIEVATLRGRMTEKEKQHGEDLSALEAVRTENGQLRIGIGEYKGRAFELERRLALLDAPKAAEPEPQAAEEVQQTETPEPPTGPVGSPSLWRRIFGKSRSQL